MTTLVDARADRLDRLGTTPCDLLVVGGGINGAGIALDAAARGLRTVLVERDDLAVGTSSRSSKLIHGGLRYLEHYRFGLVREALAERDLLTTRLAPHLVRTERFVVPVTGSRWETAYIGAGLTLYDLLGGRRAGRFRLLSRDETRARVPSLRSEGVRAAFEYSDGVVDDARYVVTVARSAARQGALVLTRCEVVGWRRSGGRVSGAVLWDRLGGGEHAVSARVVVDATGVFAADTGQKDTALRPSRGTHLVLPRAALHSERGLTLRVPGRVVFCVPWEGQWLVGTTDVPHEGPVSRPRATEEEVRYLIDALRRVVDTSTSVDDVIATFAGIRPLVGEGDDTVRLSREESIEQREPGLIAVRGGKYTTYRRVAERVVERATELLEPMAPSPTARLPLVGAVARSRIPALMEELMAAGWDEPIARHLVSRYGSEAGEVTGLAREQGSTASLIEGLPYLEAEVTWAVRREHALSLDDVLARRTRVAIQTPDHGRSVAPRVAELIGAELGWDRRDRERAVAEYVEGVVGEYRVPGRLAPREEAVK